MTETPQLKQDFVGRVRNFALGPTTPGNALIPLFEAVQNSIQAITSEFGSKSTKKGEIEIYVEWSRNDIPNFTISDNGIGLDRANFDSFLTLDSDLKLEIGGKGVGRITWVKVFDEVVVASTYRGSAGKVMQRSFKFRASREPIADYKERGATGADVGTEVKLKNMKVEYANYCPSKIETIGKRLISHFLAQFLSKDRIPIIVSDAENELNLNDTLADKMFRVTDVPLKDKDGNEFVIHHMLLARDVVTELSEHSLFFVADKRIVSSHGLNNQIGISTNIDAEGTPCKYIGLISGRLLDRNVATERNRFDLDSKKMAELAKLATDATKLYLKEEIDSVVDSQVKELTGVLHQFPRYAYLVKNPKQFVKSKLPLNAGNSEEIYKHLSVYDYRESRDIIKDVNSAINSPESIDLEDEAKKIVGRILAQERSSLLEYIAKRKLIIDLLYSRLGYENADVRKRFTEEAVHKIICPLRVSQGDIRIDEHNLWLIDDKLAYYEFWASDKRIKEFIKDSESKKRPDIILFQGSTLFQRTGAEQPVVVIEFKRPARDEYTDSENPIAQLYDYIRELRTKEVVNKDGVLVTSISEETPFFCYVVADITPKLEQWLDNQQINNRIPGGRGYFGYHSKFRAYIEVLNIESLVKDARLRHEPFFRRMGIN